MLFSLGLVEFEKKHTNKEIKEKETSDQDEDNEEHHIDCRVLFCGSKLLSCLVHCLDHGIWPSFETRDNIECVHGFLDIIEVLVIPKPLAQVKHTFLLSLNLVHVNAAIEELASKKADSHNGED